jgi:RNA polymerase sigma-70 factor, ECF subfamily
MTIGERFAEVLDAARAGEDWAWASLYRDLAPELLRFLKALGATDAEDCLGETFISLVRQLPGFEGDEAGLRSFAFLIARSRLVDSWRKAGRRPLQTELAGATEPTTPGADTAALDEAGVTEILAALSPDQRSVVVLRLLHGFSVAETAEILQRSAGAVKQLQHRAVTALRDGLAAHSVGEGSAAEIADVSSRRA